MKTNIQLTEVQELRVEEISKLSTKENLNLLSELENDMLRIKRELTLLKMEQMMNEKVKINKVLSEIKA